jgi:hypothetical protein
MKSTRRFRIGLVGGMERGQKEELVDPEEFRDCIRNGKVPGVNRVKSAAIKCDSSCYWIHDRKMVNDFEKCPVRKGVANRQSFGY